jgi:hypothetical protein
MTEEDMYEEYEIEDTTPKGPDDKKEELPDIIINWVNTGSNYSKYNEFPLTLCYFNILGQVVKDLIYIPQGANLKDSRFHFIWLQTARTGKSAVWAFMNATLQKTYAKINGTITDGVNPNYDKELPESETNVKRLNIENLQANDIFDIKVYTSAGLIGTFEEDDGAEEGEDKKKFVPGALEGSGIAHWDEFESSGIFNDKKHNEDMLLTFQTFLNDIDVKSDGHIMTKTLAGVTKPGKCDCQRTLYATSYVPQNLADVIRNSGVLQRSFIYVREVDNKTRREMYQHVIGTIGKRVDTKMEVDEFVSHFHQVYLSTLKRHYEVEEENKPIIEANEQIRADNKSIKEENKKLKKAGKELKELKKEQDLIEMVTIPSEVVDIFSLAEERMHVKTEHCRPEIKKAVQSFIINLILYHTKLSMYIAISQYRYDIRVADAEAAGVIVQNAYNELTKWLEQGVTIQRQSLSDKAGINQFKQVYFDMKKEDDGYVNKTAFLKLSEKALKLSKAQVYVRYKVIEDKFDEIKHGKTPYIRYIGE